VRTVLVATSILVFTGCSPSAPPSPPGSNSRATNGVDCAKVVLQVRPGAPALQYAVGSAVDQLPSIGVNLDALVADQTVVTLSPCATPTLSQSHVVDGGVSFILDPVWYASAAPAGCFRVTATASLADEVVAQASAVIRRGDCEINGTVFAPPTSPDRPALVLPGALVEALVDDTWLHVRADEHGHYRIAHAPAGKLHLVRATSSRERDAARLAGETAPFVVLDSSHSLARVDVALKTPTAIVDAFEPDDTIEDVRQRSRNFAHELHNLASHDDVDLIPISVAAGSIIELHVSPVGDRPVDLALAVLAADGQTVIAHANDSAADFVPAPMLRFSPPAGAAFIKVTRLDDGADDAPYDLSLIR